MLTAIVFLPLLGALIAGLLPRVVGHRGAEVITSSPVPMPAASKASWRASVPEAQPMACLTLRYAAASVSKAETLGP